MKCSSNKCSLEARYRCGRCHRQVCSLECQRQLGCSIKEACLGLELDELPNEMLAQILRHSDPATSKQVRIASSHLRSLQDYASGSRFRITVRSLAELKHMLKLYKDSFDMPNLYIVVEATVTNVFDRFYIRKIYSKFPDIMKRLIWRPPVWFSSREDVIAADPYAMEISMHRRIYTQLLDAAPHLRIVQLSIAETHPADYTDNYASIARTVLWDLFAMGKHEPTMPIDTLDLSRMNLGNGHVLTLSTIKFPLATLNLAHNEIDDRGAIMLAQSDLSLETLNLRSNRITIRGAKALLESKLPLHTLNLSNNDNISERDKAMLRTMSHVENLIL